MKRISTLYIFVILLLVVSSTTYAQKIELKINATDSIKNSILKTIIFNKYHIDETSINSELDSISVDLFKKGFINSFYKNTQSKDSLVIATFILNDKLKEIKINYAKDDIDSAYIKEISSKIGLSNFIISIEDIENTLSKILNHLIEKGYTFAQVSLKNINYSKNGLVADLKIDKNFDRKINTIAIKGYTAFPKKFVKHHFNLKQGSVFNIEKLKSTSEKILSTPFVSEIKSPEILFTKDSTNIYLYLKKNKSNKFDGLIGFASDKNGKLNFNGYLDLLLSNVFDKGEQISLNWKSNGYDRKLLNLSIETPYIFKSPITPKFIFNIYKQDSSFINIKTKLSLTYKTNSQFEIATIIQNEKSNKLINSISADNVTELNNQFYGLNVSYQKIDTNNPFRNKFEIDATILNGNRNNTIENTKTNQQKYELTTSYNWTLNQKNSVFIKNTSCLFLSDEFFENELYRIGGTNSIRGFNDESIFISSFSVLNIEYQYYINNQSYLYSITDFGYTDNSITNAKNKLYSLGLGYAYQINSGIINISYAVGKLSDIPFDLNNSRFHIKLIQLF